MRYWDSSAMIALHVKQASSTDVRRLYRDDPDIVTWILSDVEIRSALARLGCEGALRAADATRAVSRLETFWETVHVVSLVDAVKLRAKRLLGVHLLRAAEALQLGAALAAAYDDPVGSAFVSLDERLNVAARKEGFTVLP